MREKSRVVDVESGGYAVVVPVDVNREVRVIEWPHAEALSTLYREIGCQTVDLCIVGDLGFWIDDEGAVGEQWEANSRAAWLAIVVGRHTVLAAGTVVVTLAAPDDKGDTQGVARGVAERIAEVCRAVPAHDQDGLTARLREVVERGSRVMTLDENGVPDGFVV